MSLELDNRQGEKLVNPAKLRKLSKKLGVKVEDDGLSRFIKHLLRLMEEETLQGGAKRYPFRKDLADALGVAPPDLSNVLNKEQERADRKGFIDGIVRLKHMTKEGIPDYTQFMRDAAEWIAANPSSRFKPFKRYKDYKKSYTAARKILAALKEEFSSQIWADLPNCVVPIVKEPMTPEKLIRQLTDMRAFDEFQRGDKENSELSSHTVAAKP